MGKTICLTSMLVTLVVLSALSLPQEGTGAGSGTPGMPDELLSVGKIGSKPIEMKIRTGKSEDGKTVLVHVRASRKAYVVAVYVSPTGDARVLFPNREHPNNLVEAGKEYDLFDARSRTQLKTDDLARDGTIIFYVSSRKADLKPLKSAEGKPFVEIPSSAGEGRKALVKQLEKMAKDEGFNRYLLAVQAAEEGEPLHLMGAPKAIKTEKPEPVTGVQGVGDKPETVRQEPGIVDKSLEKAIKTQKPEPVTGVQGVGDKPETVDKK